MIASGTRTSYWQLFRLIFVVFFLYLMGDAFYRWDGFRYYGTFSEFLLSVALAAVILSIVTAGVVLLIWFPYVVINHVTVQMRWHRERDLFTLFIAIFLIITAAAWGIKRFVFPLVNTSHQVKIVVLLSVLGSSVLITWWFKDKFGQWKDKTVQWMVIIQNNITPLVWLFGIFVFLSVPAVIYQTWFNETDRKVSKEIIKRSDTKKKQPNIILVTFDAMTARDMSLYGYSRPTTPFIDEWADTASVFTKAEAASDFTSPTTASLVTGKRVWSHLRFSRMQGTLPIKTDTESLPVVLKNNGYYNMAFMVNAIASVDNLGVADSFDIAPLPTEFMITRNITRVIHKATAQIFSRKFKIYNWFLQEGFITEKLFQRLEKDFDETEFPPEIVFKKLLNAIDNGEKPFFAWVHLNVPHAPYLPPGPYKGMFDNSEKMRTLTSQLKERNELLEYLDSTKRFPPEIDTLRARYDEYVRYCDDQFKDFIEELKRRERLNNTVIILSTDHGEIFDHNSILHGDTLYEPETHIPLVIKEPGQSKVRVVDDLVEQIDIPATILDLADIQIPSWMEGRSLLPLMRGEVIEPKLVFSMNVEGSSSRNHQITKGTIAVWDGDYKLIQNIEKEESMLFNLKNDPGELNNIVNIEPETGRRLLNLIHENLKKANDRIIMKD